MFDDQYGKSNTLKLCFLFNFSIQQGRIHNNISKSVFTILLLLFDFATRTNEPGTAMVDEMHANKQYF